MAISAARKKRAFGAFPPFGLSTSDVLLSHERAASVLLLLWAPGRPAAAVLIVVKPNLQGNSQTIINFGLIQNSNSNLPAVA